MRKETILIENGTLVTSSTVSRSNLLIRDGIISGTGSFSDDNILPDVVIDADHKLVFPGGVDPHVHLALPTPYGPSSDDFISGSRAALAGGSTSFIDFVTPLRGQSLREAFYERKKEAETSLIDHGLHLGISEWNQKIRTDLTFLLQNENIRSVKTYLAYLGTIGIGYRELYEVMETTVGSGGIVLVHCEEGETIRLLQSQMISQGKISPRFHAVSRPTEAEIRAVENVIDLSAKTSCPVYIVHVSTAKTAEIIKQAKKSGLKIFAETCPQYLLLDESVYDQDDISKILPYIISPPLRSVEDQEMLWTYLADGTFDTVATDHCPFNLLGQKDQGIDDFRKIPNGAGGIEYRLSLLYSYGVLKNRISLPQFVALTSAAPAGIFGFGNRKGNLEPGFDADIVIWDPEVKKQISVSDQVQRCDSNIYQGFPVQGSAECVLVRGEIVFSNGMILPPEEHGRLLRTG